MNNYNARYIIIFILSLIITIIGIINIIVHIILFNNQLINIKYVYPILCFTILNVLYSIIMLIYSISMIIYNILIYNNIIIDNQYI